MDDGHGCDGKLGTALAADLAPLAGRRRMASIDAIRVRGYRSNNLHRSGVCPSPRKNGERERTALSARGLAINRFMGEHHG
jgi:hypothetical protein